MRSLFVPCRCFWKTNHMHTWFFDDFLGRAGGRGGVPGESRICRSMHKNLITPCSPQAGVQRILRAYALCRRPPISSYVFTACDSRCQRRDILIIVGCMTTSGMLLFLSERACCFVWICSLACVLLCEFVGWRLLLCDNLLAHHVLGWLFRICLSCFCRNFDTCLYSVDVTFWTF